MPVQKTTKPKSSKRKEVDLHLDRRAITTLSLPNSENPSVFEFRLSLYAIPNQQFDIEEYETQINAIKKFSSRLLRYYVYNNRETFDSRYILDMNFTSANLKKGYNKSVQFTLLLKRHDICRLSKTKKFIVQTIKPIINSITNKIVEEGFRCHKRKQALNKSLKTCG